MTFDEFDAMNQRLRWKVYLKEPYSYIIEDVTDYNGISKAGTSEIYQTVIGATVTKMKLFRNPSDPENAFCAVLPIVSDRFGNLIGSDLRTSRLEHIEESPTTVKLMTKNSVYVLRRTN